MVGCGCTVAIIVKTGRWWLIVGIPLFVDYSQLDNPTASHDLWRMSLPDLPAVCARYSAYAVAPMFLRLPFPSHSSKWDEVGMFGFYHSLLPTASATDQWATDAFPIREPPVGKPPTQPLGRVTGKVKAPTDTKAARGVATWNGWVLPLFLA